jgi:uncharacterized protein YjdB
VICFIGTHIAKSFLGVGIPPPSDARRNEVEAFMCSPISVSKNPIRLGAIAALAIIAGLWSCKLPIGIIPGEGEKITGVALNKTSISLVVGSTERLVATVAPSTAANKAVSWSGSNGTVDVTPQGVVTAIAPGTATITATTMGGMFSAACTVTVSAPPIAVTGVTLNMIAVSLPAGLAEQLVATIAPADATNKSVAWSSDSANASVSSSGLVAAVAVGSALIKATTADGSFTASCLVTVTPVRVTGIALNKVAASIGLGLTEQLSATISPGNATNKAISWSSSSPNASVSPAGLVTAVALGAATITATTSDGAFAANCAVTVIPVPVTGVALNKVSSQLAAGTSENLIADVLPSNAANKTIAWSSSDTNIAVVSAGRVMGLAAGTATITATTADGGFSAACLITVVGSLLHTYGEVLPAATALQNGMNAALASNDPTTSAYSELVVTPVMVVTCYLSGYLDSSYTLNGSIAVNVNGDYSAGAMNGTVLFAGGVVTEISYSNAIFSSPMSGSLGIKFSDAARGSLNLATGVFTQY